MNRLDDNGWMCSKFYVMLSLMDIIYTYILSELVWGFQNMFYMLFFKFYYMFYVF